MRRTGDDLAVHIVNDVLIADMMDGVAALIPPPTMSLRLLHAVGLEFQGRPTPP